MDDRRVPGSPRLPMGHMAVILLTAAFVVLVGVKKPYYNWDVIGYVASAHFEDGLRGTELRAASAYPTAWRWPSHVNVLV